MCNIKIKDFYNFITGEDCGKDTYSIFKTTYIKCNYEQLIYDSRGKYLGLRRRKIDCKNGKIVIEKHYKFESFLYLKSHDNIPICHCETPRISTVENTQMLHTYSYRCLKCRGLHYITKKDYDSRYRRKRFILNHLWFGFYGIYTKFRWN